MRGASDVPWHPVLLALVLGAGTTCSPPPQLSASAPGALAGHPAESPAGPPEPCRPTGWVDRIEGSFAVLELDDREEEEIYPVACFPEQVIPGTRVENGRVDLVETERMRLAIQAQVERLLRRSADPPARE